jgi:hypothetical protein
MRPCMSYHFLTVTSFSMLPNKQLLSKLYYSFQGHEHNETEKEHRHSLFLQHL